MGGNVMVVLPAMAFEPGYEAPQASMISKLHHSGISSWEGILYMFNMISIKKTLDNDLKEY